MDEQQVIAIFRREIEVHQAHANETIKTIARESATDAIYQTFRLLGIKMNDDGLKSAQLDFTFLNQLRMGSQYTRGIIFKTCLGAMVTAGLTLLAVAIGHEIQSWLRR